VREEGNREPRMTLWRPHMAATAVVVPLTAATAPTLEMKAIANECLKVRRRTLLHAEATRSKGPRVALHICPLLPPL
jgi:hypothetical protein